MLSRERADMLLRKAAQDEFVVGSAALVRVVWQ